MRIAVIGSHLVGKTTLAEALAEKLEGYEYLPEPYHQMSEFGYSFADIPDGDDYVAQFEFSIKQIISAGEDVIFDRCPLDILTYYSVVNNGEKIRHLYDKLIAFLPQMDIFVYVPIENPDRMNCQEDELPELRREVDELLREWLDELDIEVVEVGGNLRQRIDQIIAFMEKTGEASN